MRAVLALCLCAALVGSAAARPGGWGFGDGDGWHSNRPGRPGWGPDAINVTIGIDREAFLTGELNEDFCAEVSTAGRAGGWQKIDAVDDINDLELADEEIRNVTLAVMTRALPRRSLLRCRPENRTESIEGCSRVVEGTEYQLRLTVTCERRNRTDGATVEVTGVVDALVALPANDVPSVNITGVELSIGGEWVNGTEVWEGMWRPWSGRKGGFP